MANSAPGVTLFDSSDVELGTLANPVRVDPTGTTTQPVSGTVTSNIGTTGGLALDATLTNGTQKTKIVDAGGTNLATVSAAGAVKVDGSAVIQPVSGTVTANQGTAAALAGHWPVQVTDGTNVMPTMDAITRPGFQKITDGTNTLAVNGDGSINVSVSGGVSPFFLDFRAAAVTAKTYYVVLDRDNSSTDYKHTSGTTVKLYALEAQAYKSKNVDQWDVELGVIRTISGANANIAWLVPGTMYIHDSGTFQEYRTREFDEPLDVTISAGDFTKIAAGHVETTTDITTASTIADVKGTLITPAIGDIVMRINPNGGVGGNITVRQHLAYTVA